MHIFISYAKNDTRDLALQIYGALSALPGVTAWMDASLEAAESWAQQIQSEIDRSHMMIVLLSPDVNRPATRTQRRSFVLNEIDYAQSINRPILPVMAQTTQVPVQLAGIQYVDAIRDRQVGVQRIIDEVSRRASMAAPAVPPPRSIPQPARAAPQARPGKSRLSWRCGCAVLIAALLVCLVLGGLVETRGVRGGPKPGSDVIMPGQAVKVFLPPGAEHRWFFPTFGLVGQIAVATVDSDPFMGDRCVKIASMRDLDYHQSSCTGHVEIRINAEGEYLITVSGSGASFGIYRLFLDLRAEFPTPTPGPFHP